MPLKFVLRDFLFRNNLQIKLRKSGNRYLEIEFNLLKLVIMFFLITIFIYKFKVMASF